MAYATLTSVWPSSDGVADKKSNLAPLLFLTVFIPFVLWDQSFVADKLDFIVKLGGSSGTIFLFQAISLIAISLGAATMFIRFLRPVYDYTDVRSIFIIYLGIYAFLSFLLTGILVHPIEQYLYLVNIAVILVALPSLHDNFKLTVESPAKWVTATGLCIILIAILAVIALQSHPELPGSQIRFK